MIYGTSSVDDSQSRNNIERSVDAGNEEPRSGRIEAESTNCSLRCSEPWYSLDDRGLMDIVMVIETDIFARSSKS